MVPSKHVSSVGSYSQYMLDRRVLASTVLHTIAVRTSVVTALSLVATKPAHLLAIDLSFPLQRAQPLQRAWHAASWH